MLGGIARRRGLVSVVSDFLEPPEEWERSLAQVAVRHETVCIEIVDPREVELPSVGVLSLVDPRTGEVLEIQTANPKVRERYAAAAAGPARRHRLGHPPRRRRPPPAAHRPRLAPRHRPLRRPAASAVRDIAPRTPA